MFLNEFGFELPAIVNFVGGGGKTGLILDLLEEYSGDGAAVYTTTTRIHPPHPRLSLTLVASNNHELLRLIVERAARTSSEHRCRLVVTSGITSPGLLGGVDQGFAKRLTPGACPLILNEADGARSMSLKMPREGEPVLMEGARYLVPVVGLDVLNRPLGPDTLFRWEPAAARHGLVAGEVLTPSRTASLLLHRDGVCRGWEPDMKIVPFINKVDDSSMDADALELARALIINPDFPVERVVWGSLHSRRAGSVDRRGR